MENFRLFLIRLLQVLWVFAVLAAISVIFSEGFEYFFGVLLMIGIPLVVIQYLVFASLNPIGLFDGRIKKGMIT
ncbi:hypothetical protein ACTXLJ_05425 [Psychrobacter celer]|uniref:hypothetical protein n=1 Tax=Psychrobacter celer TaxID=306572 RepID=UPI003FD09E78